MTKRDQNVALGLSHNGFARTSTLPTPSQRRVELLERAQHMGRKPRWELLPEEYDSLWPRGAAIRLRVWEAQAELDFVSEDPAGLLDQAWNDVTDLCAKFKCDWNLAVPKDSGWTSSLSHLYRVWVERSRDGSTYVLTADLDVPIADAMTFADERCTSATQWQQWAQAKARAPATNSTAWVALVDNYTALRTLCQRNPGVWLHHSGSDFALFKAVEAMFNKFNKGMMQPTARLLLRELDFVYGLAKTPAEKLFETPRPRGGVHLEAQESRPRISLPAHCFPQGDWARRYVQPEVDSGNSATHFTEAPPAQAKAPWTCTWSVLALKQILHRDDPQGFAHLDSALDAEQWDRLVFAVNIRAGVDCERLNTTDDFACQRTHASHKVAEWTIGYLALQATHFARRGADFQVWMGDESRLRASVLEVLTYLYACSELAGHLEALCVDGGEIRSSLSPKQLRQLEVEYEALRPGADLWRELPAETIEPFVQLAGAERLLRAPAVVRLYELQRQVYEVGARLDGDQARRDEVVNRWWLSWTTGLRVRPAPGYASAHSPEGGEDLAGPDGSRSRGIRPVSASQPAGPREVQ